MRQNSNFMLFLNKLLLALIILKHQASLKLFKDINGMNGKSLVK
jgi:hypothetical protein